MKKLKIFYMLLGCLLAFAACSDDDYTPATSPLKVTESSVAFNAKGGDGEITVSSTTPIASVESSDEWCAVSKDGDYKVKVTVSSNEEVDARNSVVTIKDQAGNETHIAVSQSGMLFYLNEHKYIHTDAAGTGYLKLMHSYDVTLSVDEDANWFTASVQGDSIVFNMEDNTSGNVRSAYVYCTSGPRKDSVLVTQGEAKDVYGDYLLIGKNSKGQYISLSSNLAEGASAGTLKWTIPALKASVELPFDEENLSFKYSAGLYWGEWVETDEETEEQTTYYIYSTLWDTSLGYLTWGNAYSIDGVILGDSEAGTMISFEDNGSWSGYNVDAIRFELFSAQELTSANYVAGLTYFKDPFMQKKQAVSESKYAGAAPKLSIMK